MPTFTYQRTSSCASYWLLFYFFSPSSTGMIMDTWGGRSGPRVPPPGCAHVYLPENIIMCIILAFISFLLPKFNRNDNGYMCVCVWGGGGLDPVSLPLDVPMFTYQRTSSCASYWLLFHFSSPSSTGMIMDTCVCVWGGGGVWTLCPFPWMCPCLLTREHHHVHHTGFYFISSPQVQQE